MALPRVPLPAAPNEGSLGTVCVHRRLDHRPLAMVAVGRTNIIWIESAHTVIPGRVLPYSGSPALWKGLIYRLLAQPNLQSVTRWFMPVSLWTPYSPSWTLFPQGRGIAAACTVPRRRAGTAKQIQCLPPVMDITCRIRIVILLAQTYFVLLLELA